MIDGHLVKRIEDMLYEAFPAHAGWVFDLTFNSVVIKLHIMTGPVRFAEMRLKNDFYPEEGRAEEYGVSPNDYGEPNPYTMENIYDKVSLDVLFKIFSIMNHENGFADDGYGTLLYNVSARIGNRDVWVPYQHIQP